MICSLVESKSFTGDGILVMYMYISVIEAFCGVFVLLFVVLNFLLVNKDFCYKTESDLFLFLYMSRR